MLLGIDAVVAAINEIFELPSKMYTGIDLRKFVSFYEIEINSMYNTAKDTYSMMSTLYRDSSNLSKINKILEGSYMQFSLKLVPSGKMHDDKEWHDLVIEPKIGARNNFIIRVIARSQDFGKILEIGRRTENDITSIIENVLSK